MTSSPPTKRRWRKLLTFSRYRQLNTLQLERLLSEDEIQDAPEFKRFGAQTWSYQGKFCDTWFYIQNYGKYHIKLSLDHVYKVHIIHNDYMARHGCCPKDICIYNTHTPTFLKKI